jgi:ferredoxin-type protein NapH
MKRENEPEPDNGSHRPKTLRTRIRNIRWISQISFLALFLLLIAGTVCTVALGRGVAVSEPFGVLQVIVAGATSSQSLSVLTPLIVGAMIFVVVVVVFGRAFCAWACPVGTIIDAIDVAFQRLKFRPFLTRNTHSGDSNSNSLLRNGMNRYAIMTAGLTGSALFKFPVWCVFCPIGTICRGAASGAELAIGAELLAVPAVGALSLGEKRFWCRYLCPVGGALTLLSRLNPFFKPQVADGTRHNCGACRSICPEGIDICREKSFARCTKCFECYAKCPFESVKIALF